MRVPRPARLLEGTGMRRTNWIYFVVGAIVLSVGISAAGARVTHHSNQLDRAASNQTGKGHTKRGATTTTSTSATTTTLPTTTTVRPTTTTTAPTTTIPATTTTTRPGIDLQPAFPIRAAFYYPWFPEAWNQRGITPYSNFTPSLG